MSSVEEVARHEHACHEDKQKAKVKACAVELNRKVVWVGIAFHGLGQRRMNCIAARAPRKKTVGMPRVCKASQRTVKIGELRGVVATGGDCVMTYFSRMSSSDLPS